MRLLVLALSLTAGCAGTGFGPDVVVPERGCDAVCESVEHELAAIDAGWGGWCGTGRVAAMGRILDHGDAAVPTLARELNAGARGTAISSARALAYLGHEDLVDRWCELEPLHPYRAEMCR